MIRLPCPDCKNDSWRASVEDYISCVYCGSVYSSKYGSLPRIEKTEYLKHISPRNIFWEEEHAVIV
jgi:ribosomal protein S27E